LTKPQNFKEIIFMSKIPPIGPRVPPGETFVKKEANKISKLAQEHIIPVHTKGKTKIPKHITDKHRVLSTNLHKKVEEATKPPKKPM
jgi:hypothetical protein